MDNENKDLFALVYDLELNGVKQYIVAEMLKLAKDAEQSTLSMYRYDALEMILHNIDTMQ